MADSGISRLADAPEPATTARHRVLPSTWMAGVAFGLTSGLLLAVRDRADVDLWLHLRIGEMLLSGERFGSLPDPLATLADRPYIPTQWLGQVTMSWVFEFAGMTGVQLARVLLVFLLGAAVLVGCLYVSESAPALIAATITMFGSAAAWSERPQLAGMVFLAVTVAIWWRSLERSCTPWSLVPLSWLWACVHGTWVLGLVTGALFVIGGALDARWRGRRLAMVAAVPPLGLAAACLTPLGPAVLLEPFRVGQVARLTANEWMRPSPDNVLLLVVLAACAVALLAVARSRHCRWTRVLSALFGLVMALWMVRTIAIGAIVVAPALAVALGTLVRRRGGLVEAGGSRGGRPPASSTAAIRLAADRRVFMVAGALMLCIALGHLLAVPMRAPVTGEVSRALDALPRGTGTQLAVDGRAVGWVQWAHPDRLPMRDLRAEVYSVPTALAYEDFQEARPGWQRYAATHHVGAVLADRERALDHALSTEPGWTVAAEDPDFRLWVHK